jgi:AcrR family transcriptional regulator
MPPKFKFTRDEITNAALNVTRKNGISGLTARALAAELGCSVKPIFGLFKNMEEVGQEVFIASDLLYQNYLREDMAKGKYSPYKASGMAYIRFAKEERELFKLLFMRDRSREKIEENKEEIRPLMQLIQQNLEISEDEAYLFHLEMWLYVHGIATMIATSYLDWDDEFISRVLTDAYMGLKYRYTEGKDNAGN